MKTGVKSGGFRTALLHCLLYLSAESYRQEVCNSSRYRVLLHTDKRTGYLYQVHYKAILTEKDYLLELSWLVVLNPASAVMIEYPGSLPFNLVCIRQQGGRVISHPNAILRDLTPAIAMQARQRITGQ